MKLENQIQMNISTTSTLQKKDDIFFKIQTILDKIQNQEIQSKTFKNEIETEQIPTDFNDKFKKSIKNIKSEGRYREFKSLIRTQELPSANYFEEVDQENAEQ